MRGENILEGASGGGESKEKSSTTMMKGSGIKFEFEERSPFKLSKNNMRIEKGSENGFFFIFFIFSLLFLFFSKKVFPFTVESVILPIFFFYLSQNLIKIK